MSKNFRAYENVVGTRMENIELENGSTEILIPKNIGIMENVIRIYQSKHGTIGWSIFDL